MRAESNFADRGIAESPANERRVLASRVSYFPKRSVEDPPEMYEMKEVSDVAYVSNAVIWSESSGGRTPVPTAFGSSLHPGMIEQKRTITRE
jgi:hypothetical protein